MAEEFLPLNSAEQDNDTAWYTAAASGIASGLLKIPEGVFSLGAELIDLGADTNLAADVEQFFDKLNPFEEIAEERAIGKLTEAIVQVGVPGAIGFKVANRLARNLTSKALRARRAGAYAEFGSKQIARTPEMAKLFGVKIGDTIRKAGVNPSAANLQKALNKAKDLNRKARYGRFAVGLTGGAAGEAFVADVEEIGTFGDLFRGGPTELDREESTGREDASRKLLNRLKFGSESLLVTPFVYGAGKSAKLLANRGKDLAYSNSKFARFLDKYVRAFFSPRGNLTQELFDAENIKESLKAVDLNRAKEIVDNITREVDNIFPETQIMFDKSIRPEKDKFLKQLNELLFEGDIRGRIDPKKVDELFDTMGKSNVKEESQRIIVNGLENAREEFTKLVTYLDEAVPTKDLRKAQTELKGLMKDRIVGWVGGTYRIFEDQSKGLFKFFRRYEPTDEAYENGINFFQRQIAQEKGDAAFKAGSNAYRQEAKAQVDSLIAAVSKRKPPETMKFTDYVNKTMEGRPGAAFVKEAMEGSNLPPKEIRELFGEIQDPRYSIFNGITNLSAAVRTHKYLADVAAKNDQVQAAGGRGFFWNSDKLAEDALDTVKTGIELEQLDPIISKLPGQGSMTNPLAGKWTTKEIAEGIKNANNIAGGLQGFVRGEGKEGAEAAVSWMYRNLLLFPKGVSQLAKTVFSIPTHIRNFISAFGFAGANGNLFEAKFYTDAFKEGIEKSGLLKVGAPDAAQQAAYRRLQELGVVNSQVQIGDLKALLRDIRFGEQAANVDSVLNPMMGKLKRLGNFFQGKYVAEDDTFKIANFVVEQEKLRRAYSKLNLQKGDTFTNIYTGQKEIYDPDTFKVFLEEQAANIVKNTVPNYAFVGSAVRTARLLPIGNFMSFPSEMIRTTTNIAELGINQMKHSKPTVGSNLLPVVLEVGEDGVSRLVKNDNIFYGDGFKRLLGLTTFTTGIPVALTEGAKALYDVSQDELDALRRFVPEWSRNSTLIPVRDDEGELRYVDFSHSNAYDVISRPLKTLLNNIQDGQMNDKQLLAAFVSGVNESGAEIMNPFISESIWTEAVTDLTVRGGVTADGRRLYTDQTSAGDKAAIRFLHLGNALAPSYKQFVRLAQATTDTPTKTGQELDLGPEILGFMGLRPIKVDPERSMGFKIADYQRGIRNARREFTGGYFGLLKGGPVTENDIIERYVKANAARFNVQQNMFNDLNAAETLGIEDATLRRQFSDRQISETDFNNLRRGKFEPYFPSDEIADRFREIANNLGEDNPFIEAAPILREIASELRQLELGEPFSINIEEYIIEPAPTPPLPSNVTSAMPNTETITQGQKIINETLLAGGAAGQTGGLTAVENAVLSDEEKQITLRNRGFIT